MKNRSNSASQSIGTNKENISPLGDVNNNNKMCLLGEIFTAI